MNIVLKIYVFQIDYCLIFNACDNQYRISTISLANLALTSRSGVMLHVIDMVMSSTLMKR
jgi:hypothetical protein